MSADITSLVIEVKSTGIKEASTALSGLGTSAANAERRINSLIEATKKMNAANELAAKATQNIVARLREQDALLGNMAVNSRAAGRGTADLAAAMTLLSTSLNLMNTNITRVTASQRANNESMREAHALARGLSGSLGALWLTYGNFAGMAVGLAIGASLKGIVSIGKDVEATLEGIRVRGQESTESVSKMRDAILDLGKGVYGPLEVAKAFDVLILAGLRADQALVGIKDALNLATVGGTTIEKAAEVLVQVSTALGYTAEGFGRIADVIAKTAAVSISSVDGISESFKAASVVGKLYGQSLVDLGTQFAILSNLGIKNSAAGTASKNFFSDLASGSEKVTKGLKLLNLSIKDLQDQQGNFKSFNEVLRVLAGDGERGFNSLTAANQKFVQSLITNERGNKLMTEGLDLIRTKGKETATALDDISKQINESWGFTAQGAAAMALTVDAQFKSVKNTLETSFLTAFQNITPELSLVANRLKDAFQSKEVIDGISAIANVAARLTVTLVENASTVWDVVRAILAFKAAMMIVNFITALIETVKVFTTTITAAGAAARFFQAALGPIAIALSVAAAAWIWYKTAKDDAQDNTKQQAALSYMDDFKKALDDESTRLEKQIKLMNEGKTAAESYNAAMQQVQLQKVKDQGAIAIASAESAAQTAKEGISTFNTTKSIEAYNRALKNLKDVKAQVAKTNKETEDSLNRNIELSKQQAEIAERLAKARGVKPEGTGTIPDKISNATINDQYAAAITEINNKIKSAKKDMQNFDDKLNDKFKAGEMGKLQVINESAQKQIDKYQEIGRAIQAQIEIASKGKNKTADVAKFSGLEEANTEAIEQAKRKQAQETSVYLANLRQETNRDQVKQFEEEGNYVKAAALRWSTDYAPAVKALQKDFEKYGDTIPEIKERMDQLNATQKAFLDSAAVREVEKAYQSLSKAVENMFAAAENASQGQGISGVVLEATKASEKYQNMLPGLTAELERFKKAAETSGDPNDSKKYEEALNNQLKIAGKYKSLWASTGKAISDSLTTAFGKAGKAAGGVIEALIAYNNTDNKNISAKNKLYGDAAESAKGFFSEGSKGYQIMDTVSKAFHAAELARTLAGMAPKIASGVASLFAQGGWAGFAGAAAFLALMAGLGFAGGGSSSAPATSEFRQKTNGTGSVLGDSDAKSESIANSLEILAKDSGLGLVHFSSMDKSLQTLVAGISGLSSLLVRGTNLTSKLPEDTISSVNKLFKDGHAPWSIGANMMSKVFGSIFGGKTSVEDVGIKMNASTLSQLSQSGANVSQYIDTKKTGGWFSSDKYKTETTSLGDEINSQFGMIITSLADTVKSAATTLGLGGKDFEDHLSQFVVDIGEISTKGLTGDEIQTALETAFSKLGDDMAKFAIVGLEKFQKVGEGYLETVARLANDLIQVQDVFAILGKTMNLTGVAAVQVSEDLIGMFGSIEKLTESTQYFVDNFLSDSEKLIPIQKSLNAELTRLHLSTNLSTEDYKKLVMSQDLTTLAGQQMYAALMNIAPAMLAVGEAAAKAAEDAKQAAEEFLAGLLGNASGDFDVLSKSISKAKADAQAAYDAQAAILNAQISSLKTVRGNITSLSSALDSTLNTMIENTALAMTRAQAQAQLDAVLDTARRTGVLPTAESMKDVLATLGKDPANSFSSYADYVRDVGITAGKVSSLNDLTKAQGTAVDKQIDLATKQLEQAKTALDLELEKYDMLLEFAQQQLDAANGTTIAVKELTVAMVAFSESVNKAIIAQQAAGNIGKTNDPTGPATASADQVAKLYQTVLGRDASQTEIDFQVQVAKERGLSALDLSNFFYNSPEFLSKNPDGSHAGGLENVPKDNYIARLHKGEKVLTRDQANASRDGSNMSAVVEAIQESCKETGAITGAMQEDIRKLYKRIVDMSPSGDRLQTAEVGV